MPPRPFRFADLLRKNKDQDYPTPVLRTPIDNMGPMTPAPSDDTSNTLLKRVLKKQYERDKSKPKEVH